MKASGLLKPSVSYGKSLRLSADQPMTIPEVLHKTAAALEIKRASHIYSLTAPKCTRLTAA
ncbi:hypothetical protein QNN00_19085 [Bacillus velezensis]|nr:hypothetical protein [Bacillus velezensis]